MKRYKVIGCIEYEDDTELSLLAEFDSEGEAEEYADYMTHYSPYDCAWVSDEGE